MSQKVAFQGVHGAYSEQAIRQHFGSTVEPLPCPLIGDVFNVIQTRAADLAVVPVENALAGAVSQAYELLMDSDLLIQAEVIVHVHHTLLAPAGTSLADIKYVMDVLCKRASAESRPPAKPMAHICSAFAT